LLNVFTILILFVNSSSLLPIILRICTANDIFSFHFHVCGIHNKICLIWVKGISAIQKRSGDSESPWNIPMFFSISLIAVVPGLSSTEVFCFISLLMICKS
jgi:hypothetical protein